jgi:hypothetical protein
MEEEIHTDASTRMPLFTSLPKVKERCPFTGASRSWLIETNEKLPKAHRFLERVRERGCLRGKVFVSMPKLCAFIRNVQEGAVDGFTNE